MVWRKRRRKKNKEKNYRYKLELDKREERVEEVSMVCLWFLC